MRNRCFVLALLVAVSTLSATASRANVTLVSVVQDSTNGNTFYLTVCYRNTNQPRCVEFTPVAGQNTQNLSVTDASTSHVFGLNETYWWHVTGQVTPPATTGTFIRRLKYVHDGNLAFKGATTSADCSAGPTATTDAASTTVSLATGVAPALSGIGLALVALLLTLVGGVALGKRQFVT